MVAPTDKQVAVKCDNCLERQTHGQIPACVEVCKSGALTFEELDASLRRKTNEVSRTVLDKSEQPASASPTYSLLKSSRKKQSELAFRKLS
jgi:carbon-monoxide dehydrogenase iron sulfur subunit